MKIGLVVSSRGRTVFEKEYATIVEFLTKKGHTVEHTLHYTHTQIYDQTMEWREKFFMNHYKKLLHVDFVIAECSFPSINIGYGVSYALQHGVPLVILYKEGTHGFDFGISDLIASSSVTIFEYNQDNLKDTLNLVLQTTEGAAEKRFTIIFPADMMAKLEKLSHKKMIPKAVYIRQLLEQSLAKEHVDFA